MTRICCDVLKEALAAATARRDAASTSLTALRGENQDLLQKINTAEAESAQAQADVEDIQNALDVLLAPEPTSPSGE